MKRKETPISPRRCSLLNHSTMLGPYSGFCCGWVCQSDFWVQIAFGSRRGDNRALRRLTAVMCRHRRNHSKVKLLSTPHSQNRLGLPASCRRKAHRTSSLILTDDVGFGAPFTFDGVIPTPTLDRLAANGLRYTNFHTTALVGRQDRPHLGRRDRQGDRGPARP
jgi:hypothetical protein